MITTTNLPLLLPATCQTDYARFLASKHASVPALGFEIAPGDISPVLFRFQRDVVRWALRLGRAALFENVGLGKTFQQLEWARHVVRHTDKPVLILAPLAVAPQTVREGLKLNLTVHHVQSQAEVTGPGIYITNYDRADRFDADKFGGVVLDESSILKHYSKTFFALVEQWKDTRFRLCCTATPAPNDFVELGNHSLFLGIMHFKDMLARWFVGEGDVARVSRLKAHGRADFWRWVTSWAVCISRPADLGRQYDMAGYDLPPMTIHEHRLSASEATIQESWARGQLLPDAQANATTFMRIKRRTLPERIAKAREVVASIGADEPILLWCDTDFEADALKTAFPEAWEVRGSQPTAWKEKALIGFADGACRLLITKPEIAGFGLNYQHCAHMVFVGLSFSFERWFQAIGRIHRFGQRRDVHIHFIYEASEGSVAQTLKEKQEAFAAMQTEMSSAMNEHGLFRDQADASRYSAATFDRAEGKGWTYYLGDCIQVMPTLPNDSVDLTVTSIPFSNLYVYSDSQSDVGNAADKAEFFQHMTFAIRELLRITKPGRCCAVHVKDLPLFQNRDGVMGIDPFSDDTVAAFRREGWILQSRVTIEKDPVIEMKKTNSHGLLFKNWKEHSEALRVGLPDYVLVFVKRGTCDHPVIHDPADTTYFGDNPPALYRFPTVPSRNSGALNTALPVWQDYANPNWSDVVVPLVWTDIDQTDVLNYLIAKSDRDEKHLCPLQLDLIARLIHWKSNPGDVIFDPFGGVASTGYKAVEMGRRTLGIELKREYFNLGVHYLREAELRASQADLFSFAGLDDQKGAAR